MNDYRVDAIAAMIGSEALKLDGKTILWTGTSGFLGQWVIRVIEYLNQHVLTKQCRVLAYDMRLPEEKIRREFSTAGVDFRSHDLTTRLWPIGEHVDFVVHMAGIASPYHYKQRPLETIDVAIEGTRSALEIARHHGARFLFTSSSEVYQTATLIPTPESYIGAIASNNERSCYDVSKLMAENLTYVYSHNLGVDASTIRIFNSFGAGIAEADARILPRIASAVVGNSAVTVYRKDHLPTRTYCPAANTIAGLFLALLNGKSGQIYNVGVDSPELNVLELIARIEHACGVKVPFHIAEPVEVYVDEPMRRCPDISKARHEIGYKPSVSLDDGLREFFSWALKNYKGLRL
jgi:UDP-glucuronate decarboxylase